MCKLLLIRDQKGSVSSGCLPAAPPLPVRPAKTSNWPSFDGQIDWAGYLTPHSDIAALLVFEHQMHLMNLLTT